MDEGNAAGRGIDWPLLRDGSFWAHGRKNAR